MPQAFLECVKNGGKVRTKKINENQYMHICFLDGKSYAGEVLTKEKKSKAPKK